MNITNFDGYVASYVKWPEGYMPWYVELFHCCVNGYMLCFVTSASMLDGEDFAFFEFFLQRNSCKGVSDYYGWKRIDWLHDLSEVVNHFIQLGFRFQEKGCREAFNAGEPDIHLSHAGWKNKDPAKIFVYCSESRVVGMELHILNLWIKSRRSLAEYWAQLEKHKSLNWEH